MLAGDQVADWTAGAAPFEGLLAWDVLHRDKGDDANAFRRQIEGRGWLANAPHKVNRK